MSSLSSEEPWHDFQEQVSVPDAQVEIMELFKQHGMFSLWDLNCAKQPPVLKKKNTIENKKKMFRENNFVFLQKYK